VTENSYVTLEGVVLQSLQHFSVIKSTLTSAPFLVQRAVLYLGRTRKRDCVCAVH